MAISISGRVHFRVQVDKGLEVFVAVAQASAALLLFLFVLAFLDPPLQLLGALVDSDGVLLSHGYFDAAERRVPP